MTEGHKARAHAVWSASATERNVTCAGALAMATIAPEDTESEAAAWGTVCHEAAERCFIHGTDASEYLGETMKSGRFEFTFHEDMAACTQEFVDYCRGRCEEYREETKDDATTWYERNFSFADLDPPFEAGGTGDCIIHFPSWKMLEIVDLKTGRGVIVEVVNNQQARSYALGAMLEFKDLDVEIVRSTIVQPRASHKDGRTRSEEIHVSDLVFWTADLMAAMNRSKEAKDQFDALDGSRIKFEEWADTWLKTGKCKFCPAEGLCPARKKEALAVTGASAVKWFDEPSPEEPLALNAPPSLSDDELEHVLDGLEALEDWVKAVRAFAHAKAEKGTIFDHWILTDKIGNRAYLETDEAKIASALREKLTLTDDQIFEKPHVKSIAQIEKTLGAERKGELLKLEGTLWSKPIRGTNLVSKEKTSRPPAATKVDMFFEKQE
ncbi:MAG: DUF2800 domain-containing protein [Patescibacteria group bacterium]|nr:DUF2800 domain-containing protein [Patescibacteria group bacterium]